MEFGNRIGQVQLVLTLLVWVLIFTVPVLFGNFSDGINWQHIFKIWKEYCILFVIFLINRFYLMPRFFLKGERTFYFLSIIGLIILFSLIVYFMQNNVAAEPSLKPHNPPPGFAPPGHRHHPPMRIPKEFVPPYANLIIMSILLIGFDSGLLFFSKWMQSEQNKLKAEKESIKNKMAFLQNQVSPHFFMNTLNNIHALVDIDTEEAKNSIIKLSQMMDYMLYESQSASISLMQEMEFIKSYVDLMKLRFTDDVDIILDIPDTLPLVKIPPLLTISFIENTFKYGVSYQAPSFIHIFINADEESFTFRAVNSNHPKKEIKRNSGIGIENTRKRLELLYGENYNLSIKSHNDKFEVDLTIPL